MQVFGQFIATVGWLGLALVASELGATLIHWLGQWVGFRLIGARIVRITGFRLQLSRVRGHWKLERPLTRHPHIVHPRRMPNGSITPFIVLAVACSTY